MTLDSNINCINMETIEQEIADEYLDNLILNTIIQYGKTESAPIHPPYANIYIKS